MFVPSETYNNMGKGKNKQRQNVNVEDDVQKEDEEKNMNPNEKENEKSNNPKGVIVLGVYIHCEGCADLVAKHLRCIEGVEGIEIDAKTHRVTVKGKKADPVKVSERLRKKTGKHVELISPIPKEDKKEQKKPQEKQPKVIEVVLKVYLHCEGCAKEVKYTLHKMPGVQTVDPDMGANTVTVRGTMDPQQLVDFISKKAGRHAEIVKQKQEKNNNNDNKQNDENKKKDGNKKKDENYGIYPNYPLELVLAPQLFSDENPNACSIM